MPQTMSTATHLNPSNSSILSKRPQNHNFRFSPILFTTTNNQLPVNGVHNSPSEFSLRIAFQGSHGAYSEFAAKTAIPTCTTLPCRSFSDAISAVETGRADRAIIPVESTMEGTALRNYHFLLGRDLRITQEISLFVHYCLLAIPGVRTSELRRVISHPVALAHCGRALSQLGLLREPAEDTAGAVEMLRSRRILDAAAIASPRAAVLYGLDVLAVGLQDASWNVTRFLLLSKNLNLAAARVEGKAKTSMVVAHRGGSMMVLLKVLSVFSSRKINVWKLEVNNPTIEGQRNVMVLDVKGRGMGVGSLRAFSHVIYVDFEGSTEDFKVKEAIEEIAGFSVFVRVLGCYAADSNVYDLH